MTSMATIDNPALAAVAVEVRELLRHAIAAV